MVATAIYSVTMVLQKETAFSLCRAMEKRCFLTPVLNSQRMKKLRYAIQKVPNQAGMNHIVIIIILLLYYLLILLFYLVFFFENAEYVVNLA